MNISKKEEVKRLKVKLYQCLIDMPIDQMTADDIHILNYLTTDPDLKEYHNRYREEVANDKQKS